MSEFYGVGEQEILDNCPDEAVVRFVDRLEGFSDYPVRVDVYRPMDVSKGVDTTKWVKDLLDDMLIRLDEEYGNPYDIEETKPSEGMKSAAEKLVSEVVKGYKPWACVKTGEVLEYSKEQVEKLFA